MDHTEGAEDRADRGLQSIRAVHDEQPHSVRVQASINEITQQRLGHRVRYPRTRGYVEFGTMQSCRGNTLHTAGY